MRRKFLLEKIIEIVDPKFPKKFKDPASALLNIRDEIEEYEVEELGTSVKVSLKKAIDSYLEGNNNVFKIAEGFGDDIFASKFVVDRDLVRHIISALVQKTFIIELPDTVISRVATPYRTKTVLVHAQTPKTLKVEFVPDPKVDAKQAIPLRKWRLGYTLANTDTSLRMKELAANIRRKDENNKDGPVIKENILSSWESTVNFVKNSYFQINFEGIDLPVVSDAIFETSHKDNLDNPWHDLTQFVLRVLVYMFTGAPDINRPSNLFPKTSSRKSILKFARENPIIKVNQVGYSYYRLNTTGETIRVRGHYKKQRYGKGSRYVKIIFVSPYEYVRIFSENDLVGHDEAKE